jgi:hypothetical protein
MLAQQEGQQFQPEQMIAPTVQIPQNMVQYPNMSVPQGQMSVPEEQPAPEGVMAAPQMPQTPAGEPPMDLAAMEAAGLPNPNEILGNQTSTGLAGNLKAGLSNVFNQIRG